MAAQSDPPPIDVTDLDLEELLETDVRALTVTAVSKKAERVGDAPATVTVISHDDFQRHDWRNVAEALRSVPGVYVSYGRDYYFTGIRGLSFPADVDTRILVLLDGHPMNDPWSSRSQTSELFTVPRDDIERVEVIRGPSSSVYGTRAFFAVVNIVTRAPTEKEPAHLSAQVTGETTGNLRAEVVGRKKAGDLEVSAYAVGMGGPGPDVHFIDMTRPRLNRGAPALNGGLAEGADSEAGHNTGFLLRYRQFSLQAQWTERLKGLPSAPGNAIFNDPYNAVKDNHGFIELRYQQPFPDGTLELRASYDRFRHRQYYHRDPTDWPPDTWLSGDPHVVSEGNADAFTGGAQTSWQALPSTFLVAGSELSFLRVTQPTFEVDLASGAPDPRTYSGGVRGPAPLYEVDAALYAQAEWRPSASFGAVAGARFDYNSSFSNRSFLSQLAPRVALVWSPLDLVTLKATYGEAFRNPSFYEAFYDDRASVCGNPLADPERLRTAELGATLHLPSGLNAGASAYLMGLDGLLVSTQVASCYAGSGPRSRFVNLGQGRVIGGEASLDYRSRTSGPTAFFSVSINQAVESISGTGGGAPANSPLAVASAGLAVPLFQQRLWASARAHFVSERLTWRLTDAPPEPAHVLFEVTALAPRLPGGWRASVSLLNLLDDRYRDPVTSGETIPLAIPQDGLELRANVGLEW
jgi:iron complex outermembrane receptor protein